MSVIVKDMEKPQHCYECLLQDKEDGRCNILGIAVCDYIPKECPLVEVINCKYCKHSRTDDGNYDCYRLDYIVDIMKFLATDPCGKNERR